MGRQDDEQDVRPYSMPSMYTRCPKKKIKKCMNHDVQPLHIQASLTSNARRIYVLQDEIAESMEMPMDCLSNAMHTDRIAWHSSAKGLLFPHFGSHGFSFELLECFADKSSVPVWGWGTRQNETLYPRRESAFAVAHERRPIVFRPVLPQVG